MMTIMIVLRKQLAHITRGLRRLRRSLYLPFGKDSINPEKNQISGPAPRRQAGFPFPPYLLPTTSPPFVTDGLKSNDGFLPLPTGSGRAFFGVILPVFIGSAYSLRHYYSFLLSGLLGNWDLIAFWEMCLFYGRAAGIIPSHATLTLSPFVFLGAD